MIDLLHNTSATPDSDIAVMLAALAAVFIFFFMIVPAVGIPRFFRLAGIAVTLAGLVILIRPLLF